MLLGGGCGYDESMECDGFLERKTSYGKWAERYFRTRRGSLSYWSRDLEEIKLTESVSVRGPYSFVPFGLPSKWFDLRAPGVQVILKSSKHLEITLEDDKVVLLRSESEEEATRWYGTLRNIVEYEKGLARRAIGSLTIEIDGVYTVDHAAGEVTVEVSYEGEKVMASGEAKARVVGLYENTDSEDDVVSYAQVNLASSALSVYRAGSSLEVKVGKISTGSRSSASRRVSLFELQYLKSYFDEVSVKGDDFTSALESDAAGRWPEKSPDGTRPSEGFSYLPVYDRPEAKNRRLAALLHVRIRYEESLPRIAASEERFEFQTEMRKDLSTETLVDVVERFLAIAERVFDLVPRKIFNWELYPVSTAFTWLLLMLVCLSTPPWATLALAPAAMLAFLLLSFSDASRAYVDTFADSALLSRLKDVAKRERATVRIAVLRAEHLAAADFNLKGNRSNSDAYVAILNKPGDPRIREIDAVAPALVGVTDVKVDNLDPVWAELDRKRDNGGVDARKLAARPLAALRRTDENVQGRAPGDFRAKWRFKWSEKNGGEEEESEEVQLGPGYSWAFPILQEINPLGVSMKWTDAKGSIAFRVFDANTFKNDCFLGKCHIQVSELAKHWGTPRRYELQLQPSGSDRLDRATVDDAVKSGTGLGSLVVMAQLETGLENVDARAAVQDRAVVATVFEKAAHVHDTGLLGLFFLPTHVRDIPRSVAFAIDLIAFATSMLERFLALVSWQHPTKTLFVAFGLVGGIVTAMLIPNNLLCAALLSKIYLYGLIARLKGSSTPYSVYPVSTDLIRAKNVLNSLPDGPQCEAAVSSRRALFQAQTKRAEEKAKISLHFGLNLRFQAHIYVRHHMLPRWSRNYVVVADSALHLFSSVEAAAKKKSAKRKKYHLDPSGSLVDVDQDYYRAGLPAKETMRLFSLKVYSWKKKESDTLILAVKSDAAYAVFRNAIDEEAARVHKNRRFLDQDSSTEEEGDSDATDDHHDEKKKRSVFGRPYAWLSKAATGGDVPSSDEEDEEGREEKTSETSHLIDGAADEE